MTAFLEKIVETFEDAKVGADPIVDKWFLMKSPGPILCILVAYISFVLFLGPRFMKNRKPFELRNTIIVYNAFQVCLSAYLCTLVLESKYFFTYFYGFGCITISPEEDFIFKKGVWNGTWLYTMAKLIDLIDTCFFVLRKKQSHVNFLHVYHHVGVILFSWCILKYAVGAESLVVGILNSAVHVVMYVYYLIAALGPAYRKYLWWKKYMTWLQLAQFCYIFAHMVFSLFLSCQWNKVVVYAVMINSVFHTFLFVDFYRKTYKKAEKVANKKE